MPHHRPEGERLPVAFGERSAARIRTALDDEKPERRGINSIQLFRDEHGHWRIVAMIWDNEREGVDFPAI